MLRTSHNHRRGVVGLIAACALLLQGFLAYSAAAEAAGRGLWSYPATPFVICGLHASASVPDDRDTPANTDDTCPLCTLSVPVAATLPYAQFVPVAQPSGGAVPAAQLPFVLAYHWARPHSRGPPAVV